VVGDTGLEPVTPSL